jgi:hypothetical protein
MSQPVTITYNAPPTVSGFLDSNEWVRVIMGPVGSGKSSGCVMELLRRSTEQAPSPDGIRRTRWVVGRNTYQQLEDTTRKTFEQWVPDALGKWSETDFAFRMKFRDVESEVLFRSFDSEQDVRKALSLEVTGVYLNELREIRKSIFDILTSRTGRYPSKADGGVGASWHGTWADTNPMPVGHWAHSLFIKNPLPPDFAFFSQPDALGPSAENLENLPARYYERMCFGKDEDWIHTYVRGLCPRSDKGSVYGEHLALLEELGKLGHDFEHPNDGVNASFDLGVSDSTAIWWWRIGPSGLPDIIDWYEASGKGASHYFEVLRSKPWKLQRIWLPHDARARTFTTGKSTLELFIDEFGKERIAITPELSVEDGIAAARWLLEQHIRFHARCAGGVEMLRLYRYLFDEVLKVFSRKPLHDLSSHTADAFRYVACAAKTAVALQPKPPPSLVNKPLTGGFNIVLNDDPADWR